MSYGAIIRKGNGDVLVDTTNPWFVYGASGSATLKADSINPTVDIPNVNGPAVLGYQPDSTYSCMHIRWQKSGDTYTGAIFGKVDGQAPTINYQVYIPVYQHLDNQSYGLRVYDASGNIMFRDDLKLMEIISVYTGVHDNYLDETVDVSVNDADNNFFILTPDCVDYHNYLYSCQIRARLLKKIDRYTLRITREHIYTIFNYPYDYSGAWVDAFTLIEIKGL